MFVLPLLVVRGLPPQVRGERLEWSLVGHVDGLTPAGAGRTLPGLEVWLTPRAYPRRCGENAMTAHTGRPDEGLPPQVRGEPRRGPGPGR